TRASGTASIGDASGGQTPALATQTSTRPSSATTASIAAASSSGRLTSAVTGNTRSLAGRARRAHAATRAPSARKARTRAAPMPPDAPVMKATLSPRPRSMPPKLARSGEERDRLLDDERQIRPCPPHGGGYLVILRDRELRELPCRRIVREPRIEGDPDR